MVIFGLPQKTKVIARGIDQSMAILQVSVGSLFPNGTDFQYAV